MAKYEVKVNRPVPTTPEVTEIRQQFNFLLENMLGSGSYEDLRSKVDSGLIKTIGIDPSLPYSSEWPVSIDSSVVPASTVLDSSASRLVYRPGATGLNAPGGNVYLDWSDLYTKFLELRPYGTVIIEFDARFATTLNSEGQGACEIPAGTWDMNGALWMDHVAARGAGVIFADNCVIQLLQHIHSWNNFDLSHESSVNSPIEIGDSQNVLHLSGSLIRFFNNTVGAAAIVKSTRAGGPIIFECLANPIYFGNGPGGAANDVSVEPVVDVGPLGLMIVHSANVADNAFGGTDLTFILTGSGIVGPTTYDFPGITGNLVVDSGINRHGGRWRSIAYDDANVYKSTATPTPHTAAYTAKHNDIVPVNSNGGAFAVTFPRANPAMGEVVTVYDQTGDCGVNPVTITPFAGDTVDSPFLATPFGSKTWICDGTGVWRVLNSDKKVNVKATAETGAFNGEYDTAHVADSSGGAFAMTLPAASLEGTMVSVFHVAGGMGLTVSASGMDTIVGDAAPTAGTSVRYISDGAGTWVQS